MKRPSSSTKIADAQEFARFAIRAFERNPHSFLGIIAITETTQGLVWHVFDGNKVKVLCHSWGEIARRKRALDREFLGEAAAA